MLILRKGYCRYCGSKCRRFKVKNGIGWCKTLWDKRKIRNDKTGKPKIISENPNVNIQAPWWCPKLKH